MFLQRLAHKEIVSQQFLSIVLLACSHCQTPSYFGPVKYSKLWLRNNWGTRAGRLGSQRTWTSERENVGVCGSTDWCTWNVHLHAEIYNVEKTSQPWPWRLVYHVRTICMKPDRKRTRKFRVEKSRIREWLSRRDHGCRRGNPRPNKRRVRIRNLNRGFFLCIVREGSTRPETPWSYSEKSP
jgi:hypothetical protein